MQKLLNTFTKIRFGVKLNQLTLILRFIITLSEIILMAFSVHVNLERCTGCGNCVAACPVDAIELNTVDPVTNEKIYKVKDGKSVILDINSELCAGCGVCIEACPYAVISLRGQGASPAARVS